MRGRRPVRGTRYGVGDETLRLPSRSINRLGEDLAGQRRRRGGRVTETTTIHAFATRSPPLPRADRLRYNDACGERGRLMTYCCGILVREGLVMFADTRTNAGLDKHRHLPQAACLQGCGKRIMAIAAAGICRSARRSWSLLTEGLTIRTMASARRS